MKIKSLLTKATLAASLVVAGSAMAAQVTYQYLNQTHSELRNWAGQYANPSVYYDRNVCGERGGITAYACNQNIQLGSRFLQSLENRNHLAAKGVFAHEWGHSIQFKYGIFSRPPYQELQADCVSGAYTYYGERNLGYQGLFRAAQMTAYSSGDPTHGTGSQRANYVRNGYNTGGNLVGCFR
ncbi:hypothetical protein [Aliikangiella sp. IMCC44359]|uniref:hypothetical protein n=1 Tax=Aliikangiella sp. IMCC44359 TaxID=3459125 RepID=UPI00403A96AE